MKRLIIRRYRAQLYTLYLRSQSYVYSPPVLLPVTLDGYCLAGRITKTQADVGKIHLSIRVTVHARRITRGHLI
jgi:hypothetical protein